MPVIPTSKACDRIIFLSHQVFFSVLMGAMQVGQASPYVEAFAIARSAASMIFHVIDRVPPIDSSSSEGKEPTLMQGDIEFRNVVFNYPSRENVKVRNKTMLVF